jgi:hypothetical protein
VVGSVTAGHFCDRPQPASTAQAIEKHSTQRAKIGLTCMCFQSWYFTVSRPHRLPIAPQTP